MHKEHETEESTHISRQRVPSLISAVNPQMYWFFSLIWICTPKSREQKANKQMQAQDKQGQIRQTKASLGSVVGDKLHRIWEAGRMWRTGTVVCWLLLGSAWALEVVPQLPEPVIQTQENFDLGRVSGDTNLIDTCQGCDVFLSALPSVSCF